jgi:hypothetical protein
LNVFHGEDSFTNFFKLPSSNDKLALERNEALKELAALKEKVAMVRKHLDRSCTALKVR